MSDHTRLHDCHAVLGVNAEDTVHSHHRERNAPADRNAATHIADASAARGDRDFALAGKAHQRSDISSRFSKNHRIRRMTGIPLVGRVAGDEISVDADLVFSQKGNELVNPIGDGGFHHCPPRVAGGADSSIPCCASRVDLPVVLVGHAIGVEERHDIVHGVENDATPVIGLVIVGRQDLLVECRVEAEQVVVVALIGR